MPVREADKPFLMSIEDVFSIKGRGTVATGRVERGRAKVGDDVEIIGLKKDNTKTVITGIEQFQKTCETAEAGDNVGCLLCLVECTNGRFHCRNGFSVYCNTGFYYYLLC